MSSEKKPMQTRWDPEKKIWVIYVAPEDPRPSHVIAIEPHALLYRTIPPITNI